MEMKIIKVSQIFIITWDYCIKKKEILRNRNTISISHYRFIKTIKIIKTYRKYNLNFRKYKRV